MRVPLSLCAVVAVMTSATVASAEMNAEEIANRLRAQAADAGVMRSTGSSTTRGLSLSYGDPEPSAAAAAPSVVAVPPTTPAAPASAGSVPATIAAAPAEVIPSVSVTAPIPSYIEEFVAGAEPSIALAAPSVEAQPEPAYTLQSPSFAEQQPVQTQPAVTPVAVRPTAASYAAVDQEKRIDLRIFFEWNSASLAPEAIGQLAELCNAIQQVGASAENQFKIIGHTDKSGSNEYNLYLSQARAREVKRHLVEECEIPSNALLAVGEGERQSSPSAPSNAPEERRVEIQFLS